MIEFEALPDLVDPVLVAAFEGWNDAGDAASDAIDHLREAWGATPLAEMDPEDYYDYQVNRPMIAFDEEGVRRLTWPTTRLYVARLPLAARDVVLVHGIEPNMRWRQFSEEILVLAAELGVTLAVTLALVRRVEDLLDMPVPLGELVEDSRAWELGVDELAADDEEIADYVRQLEEARDTTDLPEASGEAIAREFERYLRRRGVDGT